MFHRGIHSKHGRVPDKKDKTYILVSQYRSIYCPRVVTHAPVQYLHHSICSTVFCWKKCENEFIDRHINIIKQQSLINVCVWSSSSKYTVFKVLVTASSQIHKYSKYIKYKIHMSICLIPTTSALIIRSTFQHADLSSQALGLVIQVHVTNVETTISDVRSESKSEAPGLCVVRRPSKLQYPGLYCGGSRIPPAIVQEYVRHVTVFLCLLPVKLDVVSVVIWAAQGYGRQSLCGSGDGRACREGAPQSQV